jgi:hypothetical protein
MFFSLSLDMFFQGAFFSQCHRIMPPKRKRDTLEVFSDAIDNKDKSRIATLLEHPDIVKYNLKEVKLGYVEGKATGLAQCECGDTFVIGNGKSLHLDKSKLNNI